MIKEKLLRGLGCTPTGAEDVWAHPDFAFCINLNGVASDKVLERLYGQFSSIGYTKCQENMRHLIGLPDE